MPTTYTDQFWLIDPFNPPPVGTTLSVFSFDIIDQNNNDLINRFSNDSIDGVDITATFPGDTITATFPDGTTPTITGATFYLADGRQVFTPSDGSVLKAAALVSTTFVTTQNSLPASDLGPPCFVAGTIIATTTGHKAVEALKPDDQILGHEGQHLNLVLLLRRSFNERDLFANHKLRPIRIMAGALGDGLPERDLLVSRQHRMLVRSKIAERMFGISEVLIPAIKLVELPGIFVDEGIKYVEYFHLLFDKHEIIRAEGSATESLFTGPEALKSISPEAREEVLTMFPEVMDLDYAPKPARPMPCGKLQKQLVARHVKNEKAVYSQML